MFKGIIFVLLYNGQEVPIPATHYFNTLAECEAKAHKFMPQLREVLGGKDVRYTCEGIDT